MTAPQHDATPPSKKENRQTIIRRQKLQRCWFVGMGLLGGFGFVTSQMSFALAATDFLVYTNDAGSLMADSAAGDLANGGYVDSVDTPYVADNYADDSYAGDSYADDSYTTSAADLAPVPLAQPTFEAQAYTQPDPVPEVFVEAPVTPVETVAAFPADVPEAPAAELSVQSAAPEMTPEMTPLEAAPQSTTQAAATSSATITLDELRGSALSDAPGRVPPIAATPTAPNIQIEITSAANDAGTGITPAVTAVSTPKFTREANPTAPRVLATGHPLAGLMEAGALAAPLSAYASSQATLISNVVDLGAVNPADTASVNLAMGEESSLEAPPAVEIAPEPFPVAVPDILPAPAPAAPAMVEIDPVVEAAPPVAPVEIVPATLPEGAPLPEEYDSIFVDPTDYSIGATEAPDVVISEQSTGCEFTVGQSQGVPNGACGLPTAPAPVAGAPTVDSPSNITAGGGVASVAVTEPVWQEAPAAITPVASAPSVNVGPVSFSASGIQLSTSAAGRDYLNRSVRPLVNLQATEKFIFPLAIPSPITSLFGFRIHPITGDQRFHAGTDIGAEQGTPVLAAQDGMVAAAEAAGGYGLMVVLRHETEDLNLESRYAHLAEIFVEAGKEVKKGDIIGLVGSTGNSTGPHLHFEMRQRTADGWVLVNADGLVQNSLSNLVNALNNPMETLSFNLSDFNLSNLRARGSIKAPTTSIPTFPVSEEGIPFRPAQPNAS